MENAIDYGRAFPLIAFLVRKEKVFQLGNTENFRIRIAGLGGRERDLKFSKKSR